MSGPAGASQVGAANQNPGSDAAANDAIARMEAAIVRSLERQAEMTERTKPLKDATDAARNARS